MTGIQMKIRAHGSRVVKGPRSAARKCWLVLPLLLVGLASVTACDTLDELLMAELPGQVTDPALNNPLLAETLVAGAQADFECGYQGHLLTAEAGFGNVFHYVEFQIEMIRIANRQARIVEHGIGECTSNRDPIWFIMHRGRFQAADAARRILAMPQGSVRDRDFLVGKAYAYEGYATQILAEAWCEMVFDGNEQVVSREDAMARAEDRFDLALEHSQAALAGPRAAEAQTIIDLARVGRARSRLNQGDLTGALSDAELVTPGFIYYATYETSPSRRQNFVSRLETGSVVHTRDRNLTVGGIPDPRVPIESLGQHTANQVGEYWIQRKYLNNGSDIPMASWREAQLMIAEIDATRSVDIINELRSNPAGLHFELDTSAWPLPAYAGGTPEEVAATVLEERRRELFLQGVHMGDAHRTRSFTEWDTGFSLVLTPIGDLTCLPIIELEFL